MTTTLPPDAWVPVPLRWRHVVAGDVFVGKDGDAWQIARTGSSYGVGIEVTAIQGDRSFSDDVDPDDVIPVLVPVTERDAVELTREQLGARLIERRTA